MPEKRGEEKLDSLTVRTSPPPFAWPTLTQPKLKTELVAEMSRSAFQRRGRGGERLARERESVARRWWWWQWGLVKAHSATSRALLSQFMVPKEKKKKKGGKSLLSCVCANKSSKAARPQLGPHSPQASLSLRHGVFAFP